MTLEEKIDRLLKLQMLTFASIQWVDARRMHEQLFDLAVESGDDVRADQLESKIEVIHDNIKTICEKAEKIETEVTNAANNSNGQ